MVKARRIVVDVRTGEQRVEIFDHTTIPMEPQPKGIDFEKLKKVLLTKKIISELSEIEPDN